MAKILSLALAFLALDLSGCAASSNSAGPHPLYHATRMQHAVVREDSEMLTTEFRMAPRRTTLERGTAAFMLPFSGLTETVFWPFARLAEWTETRF